MATKEIPEEIKEAATNWVLTNNGMTKGDIVGYPEKSNMMLS